MDNKYIQEEVNIVKQFILVLITACNMTGSESVSKTLLENLDIEKMMPCTNPNQEKYYDEIVTWLYINDDAFSTKNEWRNAFLEFLRELFLID